MYNKLLSNSLYSVIIISKEEKFFKYSKSVLLDMVNHI